MPKTKLTILDTRLIFYHPDSDNVVLLFHQKQLFLLCQFRKASSYKVLLPLHGSLQVNNEIGPFRLVDPLIGYQVLKIIITRVLLTSA